MNLDNIVIGSNEPKQTNALWIDTSGETNRLKMYNNGQWTDISGALQYTNTNIVDLNNQNVTQVWHLNKGWNWWSTYLDINLEQLETALTGNATSITSQNGSLNYSNTYGWTGSLETFDAARMYKIKMTEDCTVELKGRLVNASTFQIHLNADEDGYNWIGYPLSHKMDVNTALKTFNPIEGDMILYRYPDGKELKSVYNAVRRGGNGAWQGTLQTLEPGCGYIYQTIQSRNVTYDYMSYGSVVQDIQINDGIMTITKIMVDNEPIEGSDNLITSGAVYAALHP